MTAKDIAQTIIDSARCQIATTREGRALAAIAGDDLEKLIVLIAANAATAIGYELEFCGEEPTMPAMIGAEAAVGIVVLERGAA